MNTTGEKDLHTSSVTMKRNKNYALLFSLNQSDSANLDPSNPRKEGRVLQLVSLKSNKCFLMKNYNKSYECCGFSFMLQPPSPKICRRGTLTLSCAEINVKLTMLMAGRSKS